jgi:hypothetical protein
MPSDFATGAHMAASKDFDVIYSDVANGSMIVLVPVLRGHFSLLLLWGSASQISASKSLFDKDERAGWVFGPV